VCRDSAAPWTVFVPAQVRLLRDVVVVTRPLKRAGMVGEDVPCANATSAAQPGLSDVRWTRPSGRNYPTNGDRSGITLVHLEQAELVRKGDQVVIVARSGTLSVRMPGEALSKGGLQEQIRVRNLNSKRVVKAQVTGPGQVEVAM
jgi:flagella basal body P-ring formation protein FlgA